MKKIGYAFQSLFSLGAFGMFLTLCVVLLSWSVYRIYDFNQSVERIYELTDEIKLFASVESSLLGQQLAEEAVVGVLLANTPFGNRDELDAWLQAVADCQDAACLAALQENWIAADAGDEMGNLLVMAGVSYDSAQGYCTENPDMLGCSEILLGYNNLYAYCDAYPGSPGCEQLFFGYGSPLDYCDVYPQSPGCAELVAGYERVQDYCEVYPDSSGCLLVLSEQFTEENFEKLAAMEAEAQRMLEAALNTAAESSPDSSGGDGIDLPGFEDLPDAEDIPIEIPVEIPGFP